MMVVSDSLRVSEARSVLSIQLTVKVLIENSELYSHKLVQSS